MFILKALARLAVSCPMSPYPTTPRVLPLCNQQAGLEEEEEEAYFLFWVGKAPRHDITKTCAH